eukprot:1513194-Pyramimonas_sp.AAC.1
MQRRPFATTYTAMNAAILLDLQRRSGGMEEDALQVLVAHGRRACNGRPPDRWLDEMAHVVEHMLRRLLEHHEFCPG